MAYTTGPEYGPSISKLTSEGNLQKMLSDEKMRSEQHRTNYQTLKAEHTKLQDEYVQVQNELKSTIEETKLLQEKYKMMLDSGHRENEDLKLQVSDLRTQILTPQRLDVIRLQVSEEVEKPFKDRFKKMEEEVDSYRSEYNKMRYEFSFLKSEYEHDQIEHQRILEEIKLAHEAEVANLRKERESIISRQTNDVGFDTQKIRTLQRENAQLHLKIKGLVEEIDDIRANKEHQGLQSDQITRLQAKQLNEHATNLKTIQTEKDSFKLQCEGFQRELSSTQQLNNQLMGRMHELEKENITLKNRVEEILHQGKVDVSNLKMEIVKQKGEMERQSDKLFGEVEGLQGQIELLKHTNESLCQNLLEKERECVKKVQAAREEEWQLTHKIENEKLELETKLQEIERRRIDEEMTKSSEKDKNDERVRSAEHLREQAEKECLVLRTKLMKQESSQAELEDVRAHNAELTKRIDHLQAELNSYLSGEQEVLDENNRLHNQIELMSEEIRKTNFERLKSVEESEKILAHHRSAWSEEKIQFNSRVNELEDQIGNTHAQLNNAESNQKKTKRKYMSYARKIKERYQLAKAKCEAAELEKQSLQNNVSAEVHSRVKRQLKDLYRRHVEFRSVVLLNSGLPAQGVNPLSCGSDALLNSGLPAQGVNPLSSGPDPFTVTATYEEQERQHQHDLQMIKDRLEKIDEKQRNYIEDLGKENILTDLETPR